MNAIEKHKIGYYQIQCFNSELCERDERKELLTMAHDMFKEIQALIKHRNRNPFGHGGIILSSSNQKTLSINTDDCMTTERMETLRTVIKAISPHTRLTLTDD